MPVVRAFTISGVKFWFWSADHSPPHFHSKKAGLWEVRVHFLLEPDRMLELIGTATLPGKMRKEICDLAQKHREELLQQWEEIHQ